jgi:pyrimidine-nucleoside phosphorylase
MKIVEWIAQKRDGGALSDGQISEIVTAYCRGSLPDYQMAALAMAIYFQGMKHDEVVSLTRHMLASGALFDWPGLERPLVDKHSTGGIGDKISIVLAPLLSAAGMAVPMISGRGLGATGGTLDKLESIPGFQVNLSMEQIRRQVDDTGCVIAGASDEIAPADRRLYALRDVTATVPSIPLITASILSKKLAEGLHALVFDVKTGSGAFMKSVDRAATLARSLVTVATELGVPSRALLTDMNQPTGKMVGNANEINEAVDVLQGGGPPDVRALTIELAVAVLTMLPGSNRPDPLALSRQLAGLLDGGAAMERFERMCQAQGANWTGPLPCAQRHAVIASEAGWIESINAEELGWIVIELKGGRTRLGDKLDHSTGIEVLARIGDRIERGQPLAMLICHNDDKGRVEQRLADAFQIGSQVVDVVPLIHAVIGGDNERQGTS